MKSFTKYISKYLLSFAIIILAILFINLLLFSVTFYKTLQEDYGETSPQAMLDIAAQDAAQTGLMPKTARKLRQDNIWAMYLNEDGQCLWSFDLPDDIPQKYTLQDVAVFSKGYISSYPVFIRSMEDGLLVLGYPKDSYTKLTGNYLSIRTMKKMPFYILGMFAMDLLLLFGAFFFSRKNMLYNTEPIVNAIESLADARPVSLTLSGELSEIAESINKASIILSRQNEARANWISGVSHDIRTPLSTIMGYAGHIADNEDAPAVIKEQAGMIGRQSAKIKELIQDLNAVSQLEYEMQPLHLKELLPSKLLRSYAAELLNGGISDIYTIELNISQDAEFMTIEADERLLKRAIANLVQNSINHNPQGCTITLQLTTSEDKASKDMASGDKASGNKLALIVQDNGTGLSPEKLQEIMEKPHYMESMENRLDLRHGLGLLLVRRTVSAHGGTMRMDSMAGKGCRTEVLLPIKK
ncbi:MAG: HAMP domain-containing histidine kinase [Ruminococcus sp.]|nr:HAMP domain-containing histidine kinase [Ruminococcus sp.]